MSPQILEIRELTKVYPGVIALNEVSIGFVQGEVHALVGENGAGKSTIIKAITGAIEPTNGCIAIDGAEFRSLTPHLAMSLGISAIYQELNLIPYLTVAENIFFGPELVSGVFVNLNLMVEKARAVLNGIDVAIDPKDRVRDLGVAQRQIVEIARSISRNARIIIMDEPTAALTTKEISGLFMVVRRLKAKGVLIVYISHRLEEVFDICDRVSVIRDGRHVITKDVKDTTRRELISYMVGRSVDERFPTGQAMDGKTVLEARALTNRRIKDVSFKLGQGEILGFGGLMGSGRTELARALFGADPIWSGEIIVRGKRILPESPMHCIRHGIGLIPEDRKGQGILMRLSVRENISFPNLDRLTRLLFVRRKAERRAVGEISDRLRIRTPSLDQKVMYLSGGNQQKVVLAKWLASRCVVLIFDEPTRGIDVGTKQEIYHLMRNLADEGKGIIMISSEMPELIGMADRIAVMRDGRIAATLNRNDVSQERILNIASGL